MENNKVEKTSLFIVGEYYNAFNNITDKWFYRFFDIVDDSLVNWNYNDKQLRGSYENKEFIHINTIENRLYRRKEDFKQGEIYICNWVAEPNYVTADGSDYISNVQLVNCPLIQVIILHDVFIEEDFKNQILKGISCQYICHDVLILYSDGDEEYYKGIFCKQKNDYQIKNGVLTVINTDVLPCVEILKDDILSADVGYYKAEPYFQFLFYRYFELPDNSYYGVLYLKPIEEIVWNKIKNICSWNWYKSEFHGTRKEWDKVKDVIEAIPLENVYSQLASELHCSVEQAQAKVDSCIHQIKDILNYTDDNSFILKNLVLKNDELYNQAVMLGRKEWEQEHNEDIRKAETERSELQDNIKALTQKQDNLTKEIEDYETLLAAQKNEIERNKTLNSKLELAIRHKIQQAKNDISELLLDFSLFSAERTENTGKIQWAFKPSFEYAADEAVELEESDDFFALLEENLKRVGVSPNIVKFLSVFLYAAYLNKINLVLIGVGAKAVINAFCISLWGKKAAVLSCYGERSEQAIRALSEADDEIVLVENPFNSDWISSASFFRDDLKKEKMFWWVHPFYEDLAIEPQSLYHYVLPVILDDFMEHDRNERLTAGKKICSFEEFQTERKFEKFVCSTLRINRLLKNKLRAVLDTAKEYKNFSSTEDKTVDFIFGIYPLALLQGKMDENLHYFDEIERSVFKLITNGAPDDK